MNDRPSPPVALAWPDSVLDLADAFAGEDQAIYIVGGAVRDAFLRRPVRDLDLITASGGRRLARRIADRWHGDYYSLDDARDVGRALIDTVDGRLIVDVAAMRGDLEADLRDRDFTLNALAAPLSGSLNDVIDPTGGIEDLNAKRLRQCSPAAIENDPLRALRAVRLSVQFGLRIEPETLASVRAGAPLLARPSAERVRDELITMLGLPNPALAMRIARSLGLLDAVLPALSVVTGDAWDRTLATVDRLNNLWLTISAQRTDETAAQFALGMVVMALDRYRGPLQEHLAAVRSGRSHRALLMLSGLLAGRGSAAAASVGDGLRLSGEERDWLERTIGALPAALELRAPDALAAHRYWRAAGAAGIDGLLLALAATLAERGIEMDQDAWVRQLEAARVLLSAWFDQRDTIVEPKPLVTGTDLMKAFRLKPGPQVGQLIDALREAQVTGQITTAAEALALAAKLRAQ